MAARPFRFSVAGVFFPGQLPPSGTLPLRRLAAGVPHGCAGQTGNFLPACSFFQTGGSRTMSLWSRWFSLPGSRASFDLSSPPGTGCCPLMLHRMQCVFGSILIRGSLYVSENETDGPGQTGCDIAALGQGSVSPKNVLKWNMLFIFRTTQFAAHVRFRDGRGKKGWEKRGAQGKMFSSIPLEFRYFFSRCPCADIWHAFCSILNRFPVHNLFYNRGSL